MDGTVPIGVPPVLPAQRGGRLPASPAELRAAYQHRLDEGGFTVPYSDVGVLILAEQVAAWVALVQGRGGEVPGEG